MLAKRREEWEANMEEQSKEDYFNREVFSVLAGKSTELQWFMFENNIRDLVSTLLEPLDLKNDKLSKRQLQLGKDFENVLKRVSEVEYVIDKVRKQGRDFEELVTNQERYRLEVKEIVMQAKNEALSSAQRIRTLDSRITDTLNQIDMVKRAGQELREDFKRSVEQS